MRRSVPYTTASDTRGTTVFFCGRHVAFEQARLRRTAFRAMLRYLYALLRIETAIVLQIIGLDPGLGFVHQDLENRFSLACDVMEAARPDVDEWLLAFVENTTFERAGFTETKIGECRLTPRIRQLLSETLPLWRKAVAPICEHVAGLLLDRPHTTPLTQRNRSASRPKPDARRQQRREETQQARETIGDGYNDVAAELVERTARPKPQREPISEQEREQRRARRWQRRHEQTQQARDMIGSIYDDVADGMIRRAALKRSKSKG